jgi:cobalt-zinc-cadmium efflux system protein
MELLDQRSERAATRALSQPSTRGRAAFGTAELDDDLCHAPMLRDGSDVVMSILTTRFGQGRARPVGGRHAYPPGVEHDHTQGPHGHAHGAHDHRSASRRALVIVLALTVGFTVVEVVGGILTGSLAVLADAGHMLSDTFAIGLALVALTLAARPSTPRRSFGFQRAEILAAFVNGLTLVLVSGWIVWEAIQRFRDPPEILGGWMLVVALAGLAVNGISALILMRSERESLNVEAALRHVLADLLGSAGVLVAAVVILTTGWTLVDPIVSVAIALLIVASAWSVLRDSSAILMEQTPSDIDAGAVATAIVSVPGVTSVHDLHVWRITSGFDALSAHVLVGRGEDCHGLRREIERRLESEFEITHTTLQVDHDASEALIELQRPAATRPG